MGRFIKKIFNWFKMERDNYPQVRIASIIMNDLSVLLGEVKTGSENGTWMFPWHEMKIRENYYKTFFSGLWEDLGFRCTNVFVPYSDRQSPMAITNDIFPEEHYLTLFHRGIYTLGKSTLGSKNKEKYKNFNWFKWADLVKVLEEKNNLPINLLNGPQYSLASPPPLSLSIKNFLQQGHNPWNDLEIPEKLRKSGC